MLQSNTEDVKTTELVQNSKEDAEYAHLERLLIFAYAFPTNPLSMNLTCK